MLPSKSRAHTLSRWSTAIAVLTMAGSVLAQQPGAGGFMAGLLKQKLESAKAAAAANREALRHYSWSQSIKVSVNGELKTTKQMSCRSGPDGKPQCVPADSSQAAPPAHGILGRIKAEKTGEFVEYINQVKALIATYLPPDSEKMQAAHDAGNVSLSRPGMGQAAIVFRNYSLQGDSMTLDLSAQTHKLTALAVNSYLNDPGNAVTLSVQFATLPDGTSYPAHQTVNAPAKGLLLDISNSDYQKVSP